MNSLVITTSPFVAAAAAFVIFPINPVAAGFIVSVTGILSLLAIDYHEPGVQIRIPAHVIPFNPPARPLPAYQEAA